MNENAVLIGFLLSWIVIWIVFAVVALKVGWSKLIAIGGGFVFSLFALAGVTAVFIPGEQAPAAVVQNNLAQQDELASENTTSPQHFKFAGGTGEWFSEIALSALAGDSDRRYLVIKGNLSNTSSSETFVKVICTAIVTVKFENGKSVELSSKDICGDPGGAALTFMTGDSSAADLTRLKLKPGETHQIDTTTGGKLTAAMVSPLLNEMYASYPVSATRLRIELTAETPFGDRVKRTLLHTSIPSHSHKARFSLM